MACFFAFFPHQTPIAAGIATVLVAISLVSAVNRVELVPYSRSVYAEWSTGIAGRGFTDSGLRADPAAAAYAISAIIFQAGKWILLAWNRFRIDVDMDGPDLVAAEGILDRLRSLRASTGERFHDVAAVTDRYELLHELETLGVIWHKVVDGRLQVGVARQYD